MRDYTYYYEIKDILTQFIAAFDNCTIKRLNNDRVSQGDVQVRYVLAPKERVLYDIVNQAHNLTLPVVAVNVTSVARDETRVFNKVTDTYIPKAVTGPTINKSSVKLPMPIPVNISVSMSIVTKYVQDLDQIISNFVPYSNPYIILSWKVPQEAGLDYTSEIRSEVLWNGTVNYTSPTDITATEKYRVIGETSFTIKGWLFRQLGNDSNNIFFINANFYDTNYPSLCYSYDGSSDLLTKTSNNQSDIVSISAHPQITNIFYGLTGVKEEVIDNTTISVLSAYPGEFILYGYNFDRNITPLLSSNVVNTYAALTSLSTTYGGSVSGYPLTSYTIDTKNILRVSIPTTATPGDYNIVLGNIVNYSSFSNKNITITVV